MLNSAAMPNNHYSLALQSMIDMAIESQRYEEEARAHRANLVSYHQNSFPSAAPLPPPPYTQQPPDRLKQQQSKQSQQLHGSGGEGVVGTCNIGGVEECGSGGCARDDREIRLTYPNPLQSDFSQKSPDSMSPPAPNLGNPLSPSSSGGKLHHSLMYNNNVPPRGSNPLTSYGGGNHANVDGEDRVGPQIQGGKQNKKVGPAGDGVTKPSFSIESLLAHSNSLRRHSQNEGKVGAKESRFSPYVVPQQHPQNRSTSRHPSDAKSLSTNNPQPDEKRSDGYGGCSKPGNARRAAKSKRVRTIFTPEQLERLEAEFERQQYMVGPERLYLASSLYLTEAQVKVWFQNRRIKWRKQHLEMEQQRLAIYRSIAEQDIMTTVDPDDSVDSDYDDDDGCATDEEHPSNSPSHGATCGNNTNNTPTKSYDRSPTLLQEKVNVELPSLQPRHAPPPGKHGAKSTVNVISSPPMTLATSTTSSFGRYEDEISSVTSGYPRSSPVVTNKKPDTLK